MNVVTGAFLGGVLVTRLAWVSDGALEVRFQTLHRDCVHHLYAGRDRIGETTTIDERSILARLVPSDYPPPLTLVACLPENSGTDFGALLPPRPFNRPRVWFTASGGSWADAKTIEVLSGEFPGDPVDADNQLGRSVFQWQGAYQIQLPPMGPSGFWSGRIQGRDNVPPAGNVGDPADFSFRVVTAPPDLIPVSSRQRFGIEVSGGVATVTCEVSA